MTKKKANKRVAPKPADLASTTPAPKAAEAVMQEALIPESPYKKGDKVKVVITGTMVDAVYVEGTTKASRHMVDVGGLLYECNIEPKTKKK